MDHEGSISERVAVILQRELRTNQSLDMNVDLSGFAGWDSLKRMEMVFLFEEEFAVRFEPEDIASFQTPGDIVRAVDRAKLHGG